MCVLLDTGGAIPKIIHARQNSRRGGGGLCIQEGKEKTLMQRGKLLTKK